MIIIIIIHRNQIVNGSRAIPGVYGVYGVYGVWVCLGNTKPDIVYLIRATLRDR